MPPSVLSWPFYGATPYCHSPVALRAYADFAAKRRPAGRSVAMADAQIAATARSRNAEVLATRNTPDFEN